MEVHHAHHPAHKKKWTEYLLEFFMLFLAVFLGFIAENIREESVERHREREYIKSLVKDVKTDTSRLTVVIRRFKKQIAMQDSLFMSMENTDSKSFDFLRFIGSVQGYEDFVYSDATILQLKNSGGFRLIKNSRAIDSINAYTSFVNKTLINTAALSHALEELYTEQSNLINFANLNKSLHAGLTFKQMKEKNINLFISQEADERYKFYGKAFFFSAIMKILAKDNFVNMKQNGSNLINYLNREYHLEKE